MRSRWGSIQAKWAHIWLTRSVSLRRRTYFSIKSKILRLSPHRILKFCKVQKKQLYENMEKWTFNLPVFNSWAICRSQLKVGAFMTKKVIKHWVLDSTIRERSLALLKLWLRCFQSSLSNLSKYRWVSFSIFRL